MYKQSSSPQAEGGATRRRLVVVAVAALVVVAGGAAWIAAGGGVANGPGGTGGTPSDTVTAATAAGPEPVTQLGVQVVSTFPHDPGAFTQGLVWDGGRMFESTGLEGRSSLREVAPETGKVLRKEDLPADVFGEGLAEYKDQLLQITWKNQVGYEWNKDTFHKLSEFSYTGEGWGLCLDGDRVVMSNGSSTLTFRDPVTFAPQAELPVTLDGAPVANLNELECVGDDVYANKWLTDTIYRIDKHTGAVTAVIDASGLLTPAEAANADVLNGIAYKPETGTFLITGKLWPKLFEVHFVNSTAALPMLLVPKHIPADQSRLGG